MAKRFNITGTCFPEQHYMADISEKFGSTVRMVENGEYFVVNRPRQYGKTTLLEALSRHFSDSEDWLVFNLSFEGLDAAVFAQTQSFCVAFLEMLADEMHNQEKPELESWLTSSASRAHTLSAVSKIITELVKKTKKKLLLMVDEVDKSSNNQLFLDFLAMLRTKYLRRHLSSSLTFHSVVLAGLHDVKSLKTKFRTDSDTKFNSPWNIAADFKIDMSLQVSEIVPMLEDYSKETGVQMDVAAIAQALFYYTSGYPFLVSCLCKIIAEDMLPTKSTKEWTVSDVEQAADNLIKSDSSNSNFDTLIKNIENDETLFNLIYRVVIDNEPMQFNIHDPLIYKGILNGIFSNNQGLAVHNRIFREVISNYMSSKLATLGQSLELQNTDPFLLPGNKLNMELVLLKFQELMREEYSRKDAAFLERNGRLIFLAFLKPIINGKGYAFKEAEISEERRLDVIITFYSEKYVVELKIWRGELAHQKGIQQLDNYLTRTHQKTGYLVVFDHSKDKKWRHARINSSDKDIFAIWV